MQISMVHQLIFAALMVLLCSSASAFQGEDEARRGGLPQMTFYHRLSPQTKEKAGKSGADWVFPAFNSPEYHQLLVHRDLVRHGRNLATAPGSLTFYLGNLTTVSSDALYYALINIGTPSVSYFVALDTGSDLFWLPCECKACAPPSSPYFQGLPSLNVYAPSKSSTSKAVPCNSTNCAAPFSTCQDQNIPTNGQCQYGIAYATANTSTSGTVYQDNIHLRSNNGARTDITSPIILGCGQTQTGSLLDGSSVPDGLIGLGQQPYSVPSLLAQSGLVADSFSMCFSFDGSGRIVFGDFGSSAVTTTPFQASKTSTYPHYNIGVESITVGNDSIPVGEVSLFDTGTTTTFLTTAVYTAVVDSFSRQVTEYKRIVFDDVFEVCYQTSNLRVEVPTINFELSGAATFPLISPFLSYIFASNNTQAGFCLAVLDGGSTSIFGANFMVGYNLIFNRQDATLGFEESDCYTSNTSSTTSPAVSPVLAPTPRSPSPARSPSPTSIPTTPGTIAAVPPSVDGAPGPGQTGSFAAQRISFPLVHVFLLGLLVNVLLY